MHSNSTPLALCPTRCVCAVHNPLQAALPRAAKEFLESRPVARAPDALAATAAAHSPWVVVPASDHSVHLMQSPEKVVRMFFEGPGQIMLVYKQQRQDVPPEQALLKADQMLQQQGT